jgi:type III pantothenate kinase
MLLAVDIGNTNVVIGGIENGNIVFMARVITDRTKTEDEYAIQIKSILELYNVDVASIEGSIIASVVPPTLNSIKCAVKMLTGDEPKVVGPGIKTGINILMDNPAAVGADRITGAVAALNEYKPPIIIIDMGTSTTIEVIDKNKNYIGGMIMPGMNISLTALSNVCAQLPAISLEAPKRIVGKNTVDSMRSGIIFGTAAMLDGCVERIEAELGFEKGEATVIMTGGLGKFISKFCLRKMIYAEDLVLKGLEIIYRKNISA